MVDANVQRVLYLSAIVCWIGNFSAGFCSEISTLIITQVGLIRVHKLRSRVWSPVSGVEWRYLFSCRFLRSGSIAAEEWHLVSLLAVLAWGEGYRHWSCASFSQLLATRGP